MMEAIWVMMGQLKLNFKKVKPKVLGPNRVKSKMKLKIANRK